MEPAPSSTLDGVLGPSPRAIPLGLEVKVLEPETPEYYQLPETVRPHLARVLVYGPWRDLECPCGSRLAFPDFAHRVAAGWCEARKKREL